MTRLNQNKLIVALMVALTFVLIYSALTNYGAKP